MEKFWIIVDLILGELNLVCFYHNRKKIHLICAIMLFAWMAIWWVRL